VKVKRLTIFLVCVQLRSWKKKKKYVSLNCRNFYSVLKISKIALQWLESRPILMPSQCVAKKCVWHSDQDALFSKTSFQHLNCNSVLLTQKVTSKLFRDGTRSFDRITFVQNSFFSFEFCSFKFFLFFSFFWISVLSKLLNFERRLIEQMNWTIYKLKNDRLVVLSKIYLFVCSKNNLLTFLT
jgi:hypothetical protein